MSEHLPPPLPDICLPVTVIVKGSRFRLRHISGCERRRCEPFDSDYEQSSIVDKNKKLSYRRGTARCVVSIEILPIATQQCRNYLYDKS